MKKRRLRYIIAAFGYLKDCHMEENCLVLLGPRVENKKQEKVAGADSILLEEFSNNLSY